MAQPWFSHKNIQLTRWSSGRELARTVLWLSLPVTATNALQTLIGFVDVRMISGLGGAALASLAVGRQSIWLVSALFMGLGAGITAYVARFTGAQDHDRARAYASIGVIAGLIAGVLMMILGLLIGGGPVKYMVHSEAADLDPQLAVLTKQYAWDYMRVIFIGMAGMGAQFAVISVFNSLGRTLYPMWLLVIANIANFVGNYLLIQRYEVAGCAWSTSATVTLTSTVAIVMLLKQKAIAFDANILVAPLRRTWEMLRLGLPASLQVVARSLAMLLLIKLITYLPNSVVGQGALVVGLMAESLAFMPAFAFSVAASTLVGQNLGAEQPEQARTSALYCLGFSELIMLSMGTLLYLFPQAFIAVFIAHNAPEVAPVAASFLRIIALCLPGLAVAMTMNGVLRGSGDTRVAALITLTSMWLVRIPLVAFMALSDIWGTGLGLGLGLDGVWWAMTLSVYVEATLSYLRFRSGKWQRIKLAEV
ncbi:MATE family efflux transporter [bacterium]|nr:MATE family efflux transporter [bacterium]